MSIVFLAAAILAQPPAPEGAPAVCPVARVYPQAFKAWPAAHPLAHGFAIGRAVDLPVVPVANVRLAVQPSKPLSGDYLATASFEVKTAGTYRVAVGGARTPAKPLWLDIAGADGKPLESVAHMHGPGCTSITKIVDFALKPGRYTFLATGLTANAQPVRALIVRKP